MLLICLPVPLLKFCEAKGMFFILSSLAVSLTLRCGGTLRTVFDVVVPTLLTMSIGEWFVLNVQSKMRCKNPPSQRPQSLSENPGLWCVFVVSKQRWHRKLKQNCLLEVPSQLCGVKIRLHVSVNY